MIHPAIIWWDYCIGFCVEVSTVSAMQFAQAISGAYGPQFLNEEMLHGNRDRKREALQRR